MRIRQTDNPGILPLAQELFEYTRGLRRDFHRHPELAFHENRTAGIVANELSALGLQVKTGIAATGISATDRGRSSRTHCDASIRHGRIANP